MRFVVDLDQTLRRNRGVLLGGRQACVAEQFLNLPEIRTHVEKMRRVAVPKSVRVHSIRNAHPPSARLEDPANVARSETTRDSMRAESVR